MAGRGEPAAWRGRPGRLPCCVAGLGAPLHRGPRQVRHDLPCASDFAIWRSCGWTVWRRLAGLDEYPRARTV